MSETLLYGLILYDLIEGRQYIGGPAINIALHMAFNKEKPTVVSCIGDDDLGKQAATLLRKHNVAMDFVNTSKTYATGTVPVFLDQHGNPTFEIIKPVAYDFIDLSDQQMQKLSSKKFEILYFGTVVQRSVTSATTLEKILNSVSYSSVFFDINLRKGHFTKEVIEYSLNFTNIFKLNDSELQWISKVFELGKQDEQRIIDWVFQQFPVRIVLLTRGENGASVFTPDERTDIDGIKVEVKDTVGSGDAFSAGFIMEYTKSRNLLLAAQKGNELGAYVAARSGAVPEIEENNTQRQGKEREL